ncbi:FUSC family protein [Methylobacterium sp. GC_Met_2]|uniref:FUSC family protein n=1 Tax=Methylobacterium sp. GC_Met_2 TaxID=2937376 RepID=UPI00226BA3F3|nr:FUSC family protein [Methylobacterium sp. GC_Met_2]
MANAEPRGLSPLLAELVPFPGRTAMALRMTAVSVLVVLAAMTFKVPETAVSVFLVLFLQKPDSAITVLMSIALSVLLPTIVGIIFAAAILTLDFPQARIATMVLLSFGILWLASASKLGALGNTIGLVLAYGLDLLGKGNNGELVTRGLLYALQFSMLPLAVLVAFNLPFGRHSERLAREALAERLSLAAACFEDAGRAGTVRVVDLDDGAIRKLVRLAGLLGRQSRTSAARLTALTPASRTLLIRLAAGWDGQQAADRPDLATRCRGLAQAVEQGRPATEAARQAAQPGDALGDLVTEAEEAFASGQTAPKPKAEKSGFFKSDAFSNPGHVRYALETTLAAMACYLTYTILDWPGIHTCMITCFVGSLLTVGETNRKLILRLSGCLIGATLGLEALVYVLPHHDGITGLLVVAAVVLPSAWVVVGSERISYMGIQIAFAFCLCVMQGFALKTDLTVARDRIIGIVFGDLVIFLVAPRLYPVSILPEVEATARRFLTGIRGLVASEGGRCRRPASRPRRAGSPGAPAGPDRRPCLRAWRQLRSGAGCHRHARRRGASP